MKTIQSHQKRIVAQTKETFIILMTFGAEIIQTSKTSVLKIIEVTDMF